MGSITLTDPELGRVFFAIILLLAASHGVGYVFARLLRIPKVIGEIVGGLLLGPTVLGFFLPGVQAWVFQAFTGEGRLIAIVYWFGLVLLMFLSGFEMQKTLDPDDTRLVGSLLLGATAIPFLLGWLAPRFFDFSPYLGDRGNMLSLTIIIAIAVAVTSIPVISKIFLDLDIIHTRFARIVLTTATVQDVILWAALAVATGLAGGAAISVTGIVSKVVITLVFFAVALRAMPMLLGLVSRSRFNLLIKASPTGYVLLVCFLFAAVASVLGVNIIFGAFLAGIVVSLTASERIAKVGVHIREIGLGFFIPIYFGIVGLKLDLVHHFDPLFFLGFLLFSMFFETLSTLIAARLARQDWLSSFNFGVAMNTRGGPGIVLATVAYDLGLINETFFVTLVLIAIVTSLGAGYWFRFVLSKGWRLLGPTGEEEPWAPPVTAEEA